MAKKLVHYVVVDAFTETAFKGNPVVVCFLEDEEKDEKWLRAVAREFNIPITCFLTRVAASGTDGPSPRFRLRWFTTVAEVDAFAETAFKGNPAVVCFLEDEEKDEKWLQAVAREFNIPITCFLTRVAASGMDGPSPRFRLRWFTTVAEVDICGHGTLAATHALFTSGKVDSDTIRFVTLSGTLTAKKVSEIETVGTSTFQDGDAPGFFIDLIFPIFLTSECNSENLSSISGVFDGASIVEVKKTAKDDLLVVFSSGKAVEDLQPQFDKIRSCTGRVIAVTGLAQPDSGFDYVYRLFAPKLGVNEDQVCGSANCFLAPYWSKKLRKNDFVGHAASPRGGGVNVRLNEQNQRVVLRGKAVTVMTGSILV